MFRTIFRAHRCLLKYEQLGDPVKRSEWQIAIVLHSLRCSRLPESMLADSFPLRSKIRRRVILDRLSLASRSAKYSARKPLPSPHRTVGFLEVLGHK